MNIVVVRGALTRAGEARQLASGEVVVAYDVSVPVAGGPPEHVPVVHLGAAAPTLELGAEVVVVGRVRQRFFRSRGVTQTRTEVVAEHLVPADNRRRVRTALTRAGRVLDDG